MEKAGIGREARNIRPHSFRHTLNSILREKGYDPARIRVALGWSGEQVQDGYTHWKTGAFDGQREIVGTLFRP
jgi:integrase